MKRTRKILSLALALVMIFALVPEETLVPVAHAVTQEQIDDLKNTSKELASESSKLKLQLAELKDQRTSAIQRKNLLDQQIDLTVQQISNTEKQISGFETMLAQTAYELEEAARLDGATTFQTFCKVVMPIASPGMVTVACIVGLFSWNEYLLSTTLLQNEANFTATLKFLCLNGTFTRDFSVIMSGAVIMLVPVVVIFLLLQKQFVEGMAGGAVKG